MNNIPFPNPHDADALNDYLDGLAAGEQVTPGDEVQSAAAQMHAMAHQAAPTMLEQNSGRATGGKGMQTTIYSSPISTRTRRERENQLAPSRLNAWLSGALVAAFLVSMVGYAWWNGSGGSEDNNLAWAPQTASPMAHEPLSPEAAPWIADFSTDDCTVQSLENDELPNGDEIQPVPQGYAVTGPASFDDANAVAGTYRAMRGCRNMAFAFNYWSNARIANAPRVLTDETRQELTELETYFGAVYPQQFMAVATDVTVDAAMQREWNDREEPGIIGIPLPLEAKLNPAWAVELRDGRIAFPATLMYAANDPAIVANGLPVEYPASTIAMIFIFEDDGWKYDDSLLLCIVNCNYGLGSPLQPELAPWARGANPELCTTTPITSAEYQERLSDFPEFIDRSYTPAGSAPEPEAGAAVTVGSMFMDCSLAGEQFLVESLLTDLGLMHHRFSTQGIPQRDQQLATYLRQYNQGGRDLLLANPQWPQIAVVDGPITPYVPDGLTWEPRFNYGDAQNVASTTLLETGYDPTQAVPLEDGRVAIGPTILVPLDSRAAITYEGNTYRILPPILVIKNVGDVWLLDELLMVSPLYLAMETYNVWWWEPQYDATPVATPEATPGQ